MATQPVLVLGGTGKTGRRVALNEAAVPPDHVALITYLFSEVLDGQNASVADGVTRALGRPARDFASYVKDTAETGVWSA